MQGKYWHFTLKNPQKDEVIPMNLVDYMVIRDKVDESKTPYQQGVVAFKTNKRTDRVKKILPRARWEIKARSLTFEQTSECCKKDCEFIEYGGLPVIGRTKGDETKKRKFEEAWELAKVGDFENMDKSILIQYYDNVKRIRSDHMTDVPPLPTPCGEWYVGRPNTGKSHTARAENPVFYDKAANEWWDLYRHEEVVIIDNFDKSCKELGSLLKRWADVYSFQASRHGEWPIRIRPKKIIVTSNYEIGEIFDDDKMFQKAMERRFVVRRFETEYK